MGSVRRPSLERGNDGVAPIPAVRAPMTEPPEPTLNCHSQSRQRIVGVDEEPGHLPAALAGRLRRKLLRASPRRKILPNRPGIRGMLQ